MSEIIDYYSKFDEWGRLDREPLEYKVNMHFIRHNMPKSGKVLDNGAGPGKYAMELAKLGYRMTLTDLTPRLVEIAQAKADELELSPQFDRFLVRDARLLEGIPTEHFDAALMMGPLYHLQDEASRIQAVQELRRVTKTGGVVFVAVRSRIRKLLTALMFPEQWKPLDTMEAIMEFKETGVFNHSDQGRFTGAYFFPLAEIEPFFESHGFETIELISSSGIGAGLTPAQWDYWRSRGEEERVLRLIYESASDPSILGFGSHLLYIGRKMQ